MGYLILRPLQRTRICELDDLDFFRVGKPFESWPHGDEGCPPPEVFPSPPPIGWSTGFIATPLTRGRRPFQRLRPALPIVTFWCSELPTTPMVARHRDLTIRISPLGIFKVAWTGSIAIRRIPTPAARANFAPHPGSNSTQWIFVPIGINEIGMVFPGWKSIWAFELSRVDPTSIPAGEGI